MKEDVNDHDLHLLGNVLWLGVVTGLWMKTTSPMSERYDMTATVGGNKSKSL